MLKNYTTTLKKLPLTHEKLLRHTTIHSVTPVQVERDERSRDWIKSERKGIYGISIEVEGLDYEIVKLYSLMELFFSKINYCVFTLENVLNCNEG